MILEASSLLMDTSMSIFESLSVEKQNQNTDTSLGLSRVEQPVTTNNPCLQVLAGEVIHHAQESARGVVSVPERIQQYPERNDGERLLKSLEKLIENYNQMAVLILRLKQFARQKEFVFKKNDVGDVLLLPEEEEIIAELAQEAEHIVPLNELVTKKVPGKLGFDTMEGEFRRMLARGEVALTQEISKWTQLAFQTAKELAREKRWQAEIQETPRRFRRLEDGDATKAVPADQLPDAKHDETVK